MKQVLPIILILFSLNLFAQPVSFKEKAILILKDSVLKQAEVALLQEPITITSFIASRSAGGKHDFFSEGDYWWPDPNNPSAPYIQKDGMTNPENFTEHRKAMIRFSRIIGVLTSAYIITGNEKYARHAFLHADKWLIDTSSRMNPHMLYAQAIQGRFTGRGIGIIDMIQFMEVAQSLKKLEKSQLASRQSYKEYRKWFDEYLTWVTTHKYGIDEKNALNNHGTCWTMQVAAFSSFTGNQALLDTCKSRYKNQHLPDQMDLNGGFPKELARTKPYGYSLFNLDAMTMICQILSDQKEHLWHFETPDQKSIQKGIAFLYPYIFDKSKWPNKKDVMYWEDWPVAHPFLIFGAVAFNDDTYFNLWKRLNHWPEVDEVIRNVPVRHPIIWF